MTNPDYNESDRIGEINPNDPDPGAAKPTADTADSVGVPVGSADQTGESDFADGAETGASTGDENDQSAGNPITPPEYLNETNTKG